MTAAKANSVSLTLKDPKMVRVRKRYCTCPENGDDLRLGHAWWCEGHVAASGYREGYRAGRQHPREGSAKNRSDGPGDPKRTGVL